MRVDTTKVVSGEKQAGRTRDASRTRLPGSKPRPADRLVDAGLVACSRAVQKLPSHLNAGRQHVANPRRLLAAFLYVNEVAPDLTTLADFVLPRSPRMPLASSSLKTGAARSSLCPLNVAVTEPWFSFNTFDWTSAVGADCDHANAEEHVDGFMYYLRAVDRNAPRPLIVSDPYTMRAHVTWFLKRDVYTGYQTKQGAKLSATVLRTLAAVQQGICAALHADPRFTNRLTKNPFALGKTVPVAYSAPAAPGVWESYNEGDTARPTRRFLAYPGDCRTVSLSKLWRAVKLWCEDTGRSIPGLQRRRMVDGDETERGARLFDVFRKVVYGLKTPDLAVIEGVVDEEAARLRSPATPKQRNNIARSICRFMCTKYSRSKVNSNSMTIRQKGRMNLEPTLDAKERQKLGGKFGAQMNAKNNDRLIDDAVSSLQAAGKKIRQAAVATASGVCKRTVEKRWPRIQDAVKQSLSGRVPPEPVEKGVQLPETSPSSVSPAHVAGCNPDSHDASSVITVPRPVQKSVPPAVFAVTDNDKTSTVCPINVEKSKIDFRFIDKESNENRWLPKSRVNLIEGIRVNPHGRIGVTSELRKEREFRRRQNRSLCTRQG